MIVANLIWVFSVFMSTALACTADDGSNIDIVFVVDGSGSIGEENFDLVRSWLVNATSTMFKDFGSRAQIQVLQYSNKDFSHPETPIAKANVFKIPFRLGDCQSILCMTSRILAMPYLNLQTYTYYALRRTIEVEFPLSRSYPDAKKVIILLTDGAADDALYLPRAWNMSVEEGITNFAIGVGDFHKEQLKIFANGGKSSERVFTRMDFGSLSSVVDELEKELEREGFFCDECASGTHSCSDQARCINVPDGYKCECYHGYRGNGFRCEKRDYCFGNPCAEQQNTTCINSTEGPVCECEEGFQRESDGACRDIDECKSNPCGDDSFQCTNFVGDFVCSCPNDKVFDGSKCSDPPSIRFDYIGLVPYILAVIIAIVIIGVVLWKTQRRRSFSPQVPASESDDDELSIPLQQQQQQQQQRI